MRLASASDLSSRASSRRTGSKPTRATSPTARTRSSCSTICATAWHWATDGPARASCSTSLSRPGPPADPSALLLRGLHFAIVDEADSVLIDEARTPLILSGMQEGAESDAGQFTRRPSKSRVGWLTSDDFHVLASEKSVRLTEQGTRRISELTSGLPGLWVIRRAREEFIQQALSALHVFQRDVQYIVTGGKVQIVDEYTGRVMPDRSWEHGMHQLIEAKESCAVTQRHQTLARITYQQFFRRYLHLCGMTGTGA